jgi:hypothetical protein
MQEAVSEHHNDAEESFTFGRGIQEVHVTLLCLLSAKEQQRLGGKS